MQKLEFVITSWYWLLFIAACFVGLMVWLSYMALTQRSLLKNVLTRQDLPEIFKKFKEDLANGE